MIRRRFKHFMPERIELSATGEETLLSVSEYYGVKPRSEAFDAEAAEGRAESLEGYRIVHAGDFVMNYMLAWKGAYGVSEYDGIVSPAYAVYRINSKYADRRYIHLRLRSNHMRAEFRARSKGIIESRMRLYPDAFLSMALDLPDLHTQKTIADFLDRETARIDQLIEKKQRLLILMNQKWSATVTRVLTHGLDSDAERKPSGVSWTGDIPAHWRVMKLGQIGRCANGINISGEAFGSGYPFVSYGDAYKNSELPQSVAGLVQSTPIDRARYDLRVGDVLFTRTSEVADEIGLSSVCMTDMANAVYAGFLIRFRPKRNVLDPRYSKYLFRNEALRSFFAQEMMIVTRASLSQGLLQRLPVVLPPLGEQRKIADHLAEREKLHQSTSRKTASSIERLKEYRAALITAAVTGQIDLATWRMRDQNNQHLEKGKVRTSCNEASA